MEEHCAAGWLTVDHKRPRLDQQLHAGNIIRLVIPDTVEPPISAALGVLYEDAHLLVLDKPAPLPVHAGGRFFKNTLQWIAQQAWPDVTLKPAHRLDAQTTGVLVCGKTTAAARALVAAFAAREVEKQYLARVQGVPDPPEQVVEAPIHARPQRAGTRKVDASGQAASTELRLTQVLPDGTSLLAVTPRTGRTHQIRIHLQLIGLPIVGDPAYGHTPRLEAGFAHTSAPLCLHAHQLRLRHPATQEWLQFSAPLPAHFGPVGPGCEGTDSVRQNGWEER